MKIEINNKKYILFLLAFLGLVVSSELTYIYFNANFVPNAVPSFCTINDVIDCDAVAKTAYSTFLGVPFSVYGIGFYLFIILLTTLPFRQIKYFENFKNPESYVFTLSTLGVVFSAILWIISSIVIHKICLLCYVLYGVNFFLLIFSKLGKSASNHYKDSFKDLINIIKDDRWTTIVILLVLLAIASLVAINVKKVFIPPVNNSQQQNEFSNTENTYRQVGNVLGDKNAKLVIKEFTDFQCPYCGMSNSMMYRIVSEIPGVRVEHHDFPLNANCNSLIKSTPHKYSCEAVFYARAAKKQGKYWDYITLLFDNQQNLTEDNLIKLAESLGLDIEQLKKDAASAEIKNDLKEDVELARNLNVTATPTYIIGIKKYEGLMPYPELKNIVLQNMN